MQHQGRKSHEGRKCYKGTENATSEAENATSW